MEGVKKIERQTWRRYLAREPIVLVWLSVLAAALFVLVAALSRTYTAQSEAKASEWYSQGVEDSQAGRMLNAVSDYRVALSYWRDNYGYQVSLAKSLLAVDHTEEAKAYLTSLWQRQPENGTVNLELARLYAKSGDMSNALRFYHNAIYAIWELHPETQRRLARLELTEFLLDKKSQAQAESELIALSGNLPQDPSLRARVGDLFMRVPDYERALAEYQESLRLDPRNGTAAAGAGQAAFELKRFSLATHYLQMTFVLDPKDSTSSELLATAKMIPRLNPDDVPPSKRAPIVIEDFHDAGARLTSCVESLQATGTPEPAELHDLGSRWAALNTHLSERWLRNDPDSMDLAMNLIFSIEEQTNGLCGKPSGADLALFLIAQQNEAQ